MFGDLFGNGETATGGGGAADGGVVVDVEQLTGEYGSTVAASGVTFDSRADEVFALVGPNGAGKTTVVELLERLRTPTSGSATVLGFDVEHEAHAIKERIGVLPQSFHTFDRLTVRESVALVRQTYDEGLAGGWQQRTGLAMALVSDPELLFLADGGTTVVLFDDRSRAQDAFGDLHDLDAGRSMPGVNCGETGVAPPGRALP
jgi:ABC-type cobalamin/Fe3+-siderophores transport system ATPase subunit